jgi:hypothetical protein
MRVQLDRIIESQLLTLQKIDMGKTFLLLMVDFMLLNGDVGEMELEKMDEKI